MELLNTHTISSVILSENCMWTPVTTTYGQSNIYFILVSLPFISTTYIAGKLTLSENSK